MENSNIRGSDPGPNISRKISTCCPNSFFFRWFFDPMMKKIKNEEKE
jgi:hypothetical protein